MGIFTQTGLFPGSNLQVTSGTAKQARSECVIAVNPLDPDHLIAASKKFSNPATYRFHIGLRVSHDGGLTWSGDVHIPTLPEWGDFVGGAGKDPDAGMTDPAVVFDNSGNAFFLGEPIHYGAGEEIDTIGMFVYRSTDGGHTWSQPTPLHVGDTSDDKGWIACDQNPGSPHFGNVYVVWGAGSPLRFARSVNQGMSWTGFGNTAPGTKIVDSCFAPEISIGADGTVHVVWYSGTTVQYVRSTDGGNTFEAQKAIVTGATSLESTLPATDGWPHFPGATFRVLSLATGCGFTSGANNKNFVVAWSDMREGSARIYYRMSADGGATFQGPASGQPLLAGQVVDPTMHHFHPQIVATRTNGVVGCAYYEYGPKGGAGRIDVLLSASFDHGATFADTVVVTDAPWDPAVDAPNSHGDPDVSFIGEYFGLDADDTDFDVLWTDTRTGVQELFFDQVATQRERRPQVPAAYVDILFGVIQDGGGAVIVNGHIIRIPPRGPEFEIVQALVALDGAHNIGGAPGRALTGRVFDTVASVAHTAAVQTRRQTVAVGSIARVAAPAEEAHFTAELREELEGIANR